MWNRVRKHTKIEVFTQFGYRCVMLQGFCSVFDREVLPYFQSRVTKRVICDIILHSLSSNLYLYTDAS